MASVPQELLRELEIEGYTAVMRAIYAGTYDWVRRGGGWGTELLGEGARSPRMGMRTLSLLLTCPVVIAPAGKGRDSDQAAQHPQH